MHTGVCSYLFARGSLNWVKGSMLEPVAVVEVVDVEQLGKRVDAALLEALLLHDVGFTMGDQTGGGRGRAGGRLSGQLGHVVERVAVG